MLLPFCSEAGGDEAGTLRGGVSVLSAVLLARVASSFARIACTTLCGQHQTTFRRVPLHDNPGWMRAFIGNR
jgi:hypothetical protein